MVPVAENRSDRLLPVPRAPLSRGVHCALVEDLDWPMPAPPTKKRVRPAVWAPGLGAEWDALDPTWQ